MRRTILSLFILFTLVASAFAGGGPSSGSGTNLTIQDGKITIIGTSGGILYFSAANTIGTSAALTVNGVLLGGGAGATPTATTAGTANQVFRVPSGGAPAAFGAVDLAQSAAVTGLLPLANGGTNANITASNGQVFYSTASAGALTTSGSTGQCLTFNSGSAPTWASCTGPAVVLPFGSGMPLTANTTSYISPASNADSVEANVMWPQRATSTYKNLYCSTTVAPGIASGSMKVVFHTTTTACTVASAVSCTSAPSANTGAGCSATSASTTAQTTCTDTGTATGTAGECIDFCVTPGVGWATGPINCSIEKLT